MTAQSHTPRTLTSADVIWLRRQASIDCQQRGRRARPESDSLAGKTVLIVGGGTAGYLTALSFQRHTAATVRLIESQSISHIGVGEATVPSIIPFLHSYLGIDPKRFYDEVRPSWKLGIRFEWGLPAPYYFLAPFDWGVDSIGILGSLREHGTPNEMSLMAMLMDIDRVPLFWSDTGTVTSLLRNLPVAYHVNVRDLIVFLRKLAVERGVEHIDAIVEDVRLGAEGDVESLVTDKGVVAADFFVDCSGFRSLIIGGALGSRYVSFESSLFTDRALAFERAHGGHIKPYTTATTMDSGWNWTIAQPDEDHCGYVFSSAFCSESDAEQELVRRFGQPLRPPRLVRFRSGRREFSWIRNAAAIGNSSGFVEPLESTGLLMTTESIRLLIDGLSAETDRASSAMRYNREIAESWDGLRWFLALHYRFNRASNSPFWQAAREHTDCSGLAPILEEFQARAPLRSRDPVATRAFERASGVLFYGLPGIDCILLGQKVPAVRVSSSLEQHSSWRRRRDEARRLIATALTMQEALALPDIADCHSTMMKIEDDPVEASA